MRQIAWGETWPTLGEFRELAATRRVIPVVRPLLLDGVTPVGLYRALSEGRVGTFILESADAAGSWSRWSFIGVQSRALLRCDADGQAVWSGDVPTGIPTQGEVTEVLTATLQALHTEPIPGLPPLTGGLVGALGWDLARAWAPHLATGKPDEFGAPDVALCLASDLLAVDHHTGTCWLIANAINMDNTDARVDWAHQDAVGRLDQLAAQAREATVPEAVALDPNAPKTDLTFRTPRADFEAAVATIQAAINAGEATQVVLSQRIDLPCRATPFDVYRTLRTINPSPYMYFLHLADVAPNVSGPAGDASREFQVVGSSPETLVKVQDGLVTTFPIGGSRPRASDIATDTAIAEGLFADPKERSEHQMLVDLALVELPQVCYPATVEVATYMELRRFSHVMHLCSTIVGQLRPECSAWDALRATFPAGTLSGSPKTRAVELIDQLEPAARGLYGGTIGYFDFAGNLDMAIAIRTALLRAGRASVQAGAGIVADSVPAQEYAETRNKAAAVVRAVELANALETRKQRECAEGRQVTAADTGTPHCGGGSP